MSIQAMTWVWGLKDLPRGPTLVLLALADFADEDGTCWPSQQTIAARARCSKASVNRHLRWLEDEGLIVRQTRGGRDRQGNIVRLSSVVRLAVGYRWEPRYDVGENPSQTVSLNMRPSEAGGVADDGLTGETPCQDVSLILRPTAPVSLTGESRKVSGVGLSNMEEPPREPPVQTWARGRLPRREAGEVAGAGAPGPGVEADRDDGIQEDWRLVESCLPPEAFGQLDMSGIQRLAPEFRSRVAAGWRPAELRSHLGGSPFPAEVRSMTGLVLARLKDMPVVYPGLRPAPRPARPAEAGVPVNRAEGKPKPPGWVKQFSGAGSAGSGFEDGGVP